MSQSFENSNLGNFSFCRKFQSDRKRNFKAEISEEEGGSLKTKSLENAIHKKL